MQIRLSDRHVTAVNFVLIAAIAYFAALSADDLIARRLSASPRFDMGEQEARPVTVASLSRASYAMIVQRDVFNSIKEAPAPAPAPLVVNLHVKLLGTSELTAAKPFAIVEDTNSHQQSLYRLGDEISDAGTLIAVERNRVLINRDGQIRALPITEDLASSGAPPPVVETADEKPAPAVRRTRPSAWRRVNSDHPIDWQQSLRDHPHRSRSQLMSGSWGRNRMDSRIQNASSNGN
jgi:hypothetical protein